MKLWSVLIIYKLWPNNSHNSLRVKKQTIVVDIISLKRTSTVNRNKLFYVKLPSLVVILVSQCSLDRLQTSLE